MHYMILDLSTLRYRWDAARTTVVATTAAGEVVAKCATPARTDDREAAFLACDAALERARLLRSCEDEPSGVRTHRVALYNPYSAEISVFGVPNTVVFSAQHPLELEPAGTSGFLVLDGDSRPTALRVGEAELSPLIPSFAALTEVFAAHKVASR